jgi:Fe-S-cluster-containing dehydrogenase component
MSGQKTLYIDYSLCIGCETCEYVCRFTNDTSRIHMTRTVDGVMVPLYCLHCENPKCANACPRGALKKDKDGAVILQPMLCRGCQTKNCILACPHSAMFETDRGVMVAKCDMCAQRRQVGMGPACVEMCPCSAIRYVDRDEIPGLETEKSKEALQKVLEHLKMPGKE